MLNEFNQFHGKMLKDVADDMQVIAGKHRLQVNIVEQGKNYDIDVEDDRLNVEIDANSHVIKFWIG